MLIHNRSPHNTRRHSAHTYTHTHTLLYLYSNIPSPTHRTLEYTQIHAHLQTVVIQTLSMTSCHVHDLKTATPSAVVRTCVRAHRVLVPKLPHSSLTTPSVPHTHTQALSSGPCPAPHAHRPPAWTLPTPCVPRNSPRCAWQISRSGHLDHRLRVVGTVGEV